MESSINFPLRAEELILLILLGFILPSIESGTDYAALVYKNCTSETSTGPLAATSFHTQALESLFNNLVSHSLQSMFFRTTAGDDHGGISGLYQCRRDITNEDCHSCVANLPHISNVLCSRAIAAKIQLSGCSLRYETDSFTEEKDQLSVQRINKYETEHKVCSREKVEIEGFDEIWNSGFEELESEILTKQGYCTVDREGFRAVAQCQEDMGGCECGECISKAVETAKEVCERAVSGQVFLDQCSVSYVLGYHRGGGIGGGRGFPFPAGYQEGEEEGDHHSGRKIAIILGGGAAALLIGLIFLSLLGCVSRKDDC